MSTREERAERDARVYELRKSGMTYRAIGDAVGITQARAHQIVFHAERRARIARATKKEV